MNDVFNIVGFTLTKFINFTYSVDRKVLRSLLEEMGNTISPVGDASDEGASRWMKAAGIAIDEEHFRKVANAKDIDRRTYNSRQHQDYLKPEEVLECEKFRIFDTYGMSVTPDLVEKDDGGRLIKKIVALEAILAAPGQMIAAVRLILSESLRYRLATTMLDAKRLTSHSQGAARVSSKSLTSKTRFQTNS